MGGRNKLRLHAGDPRRVEEWSDVPVDRDTTLKETTGK
jgi:hypothetical protein